MSAGFIPGPWSAETSHEKHPRFGIFAKGSIILARAWTAEDARLIAAAPDLYEALRSLSGEVSDYLTGFAGPDALNTALGRADDVLSRARGEQSLTGGQNG